MRGYGLVHCDDGVDELDLLRRQVDVRSPRPVVAVGVATFAIVALRRVSASTRT
jgi:hypothetical protein